MPYINMVKEWPKNALNPQKFSILFFQMLQN